MDNSTVTGDCLRVVFGKEDLFEASVAAGE
jgi:hypothetical protein